MNKVSQSQSVLAKLLSKENISIQHGNYQTAFFDIKNRILGLPIWKDADKDVYDLLVGHEVGHALYTPMFDSAALPCPKDYINVVEDIRIEKSIQLTYPGLIACFRRGYKNLMDQNFFGTANRDTKTYRLLDRINLHAKVGSMLDVEFSDEEKVIVDQVMNVSTWDEVLAAAIALHKFTLEQKEKEQQKANDSSSEEAELSEDSTQSMDGDSQTNEFQSDNSSHSPANTTSDQNSQQEFDQSETSHSFEQSLKDLLKDPKDTRRTIYAIEPSLEKVQDMICDYKRLFAIRDMSIGYNEILNSSEFEQDYNEFLTNTKKFVAVLVKEFEIRKAAYQYSRATTSKTGIINIDKIHSYRYSDDIFLSVTSLANAKNHGMMMFIDFSGSMQYVLPYVLKHLINLCLFCKATGIPFQVYSFCGGTFASLRSKDPNFDSRNFCNWDRGNEGEIITEQVILLDLVNSEMSKSDFNRAIRDLYARSKNVFRYCADVESLGDTPLSETILAAHKLVPQFQAKHNIQKMNVVFLTDGDGNCLSVKHNPEYDDKKIGGQWRECLNSIEMKLNGQHFKSELYGTRCAENLFKHLRKTTGCNLIGFYIPKNRTVARKIAIDVIREKNGNNWQSASDSWTSNFQHKYRTDKSISFIEALGYNEYFIVASGDELDTETETLNIDESMTRGNMARAFSNFNKSKKVNRVFVTKFAEAVA
jgi:hypothetical protein